MARLTSSSDREKRKSRSSNRPITQGQNPQRSNRQGVSQATVSNGNSRTRTGTARVTSGQEPPKLVTRQSRVNGRLVAGTDTRPSPNTRASAKPSAKPAGPTPYQVSDPWAKPKRASIGNVKGPASNPNRPAAAPKPPVKPAGNFKAPSLPKPPIPKAATASTVENAVKGASKLKGLGRSLGMAGELAAIATTANSVFNPNSEGNQQLAKAMAAVNKRYSGKYGPRFKNPSGGSVQSKGEKTMAPMPKGSTDTLREKAYASLQKFQVPKTKATSSSSDSNQPTTRSGGSGGGGSNRPAPRSSSSGPRLAASKPSAPGQSEDMNENYRTWAAANPTLAAKVKRGQSGYNAFSKDAVAGTGPVRDSKKYKPSVASKPSEVSKPSTTDIAYNKETNLLDKKKKKGQP